MYAVFVQLTKVYFPVILRLQLRSQRIKHPQRKQNYPQRFQFLQEKENEFQCCNNLFLLRPDHQFLQFLNVFHDTHWLFEVTQ